MSTHLSGTVPCEACNGEGYEIEVPAIPPRDDPYFYRVTNRKCEACGGTGVVSGAETEGGKDG